MACTARMPAQARRSRSIRPLEFQPFMGTHPLCPLGRLAVTLPSPACFPNRQAGHYISPARAASCSTRSPGISQRSASSRHVNTETFPRISAIGSPSAPTITQPLALLAMRQHLHAPGATLAALEPAAHARQIPVPFPRLAQLIQRHPAQFRFVPAAGAADGQGDPVPGEIAGGVEALRAHLLMRTDAERFGKGGSRFTGLIRPSLRCDKIIS